MNESIKNKVSEYTPSVQNCRTAGKIDWDKLAYLLIDEHDWTYEGASTIIMLIQEYGSFILANAHALALAAKIEDGNSGL